MTNINLLNVEVEFPIYTPDRSLKRSLVAGALGGKFSSKGSPRRGVKGLSGINLEIHSGERIGLYGANGSGKTTLLRVLSGAYAPTYGKVNVNGRIASLLDITLGMDADSTGWENIVLRGLIMGMSLKEINCKKDEIGDFSELGQFLDLPLRTYSTGMQLRLAFAASTSIDANIVLLDEWLSVGDADFQKKATSRLKNMLKKSEILVIASHSEPLLSDLCSRIVYMEHGSIRI